ncbi:MAG: 16S rRNA (guanine(966)-N(2))-methyltransferase RsmD [Christensenellales bacterium]
MRVVSGKYRGRKIESPKGNDVRPTSDMVKENIFNTIQFDVEGSRFLDLFCGSGGMGIEALSRGAKQVTFVDKSKTSIALTQRNLVGIKDDYRVVNGDFETALRGLGKQDFIFVDPPYKTDYIGEICSIVADRDLLSEDGYIIYEHDKDKKYSLTDEWWIAKRKRYGCIVVDFIARTKKIALIPGSFDPITKGHTWLVEEALRNFDKVVVLVADNPDKKYLFDREERRQIAEKALENTLNVRVDDWGGMVFEYCNNRHIDNIVRGYRDDKDYGYESYMSEFNESHGGVKTTLYKSEKLIDVSSSVVRDMLKSKASLRGVVPDNCIKTIERILGEKYE